MKMGHFIHSGKANKRQKFFNGIFSFEGFENNFNQEVFADNFSAGNLDFEAIENYNKFKVNHVSLNKDWFIKYWSEYPNPHSLYNIQDLSFSFFISNLLASLSNKSVTKNNFIWYATDKQLNLVREF